MAFQRGKKWCAKIQEPGTGRQVWLGTFDTKREARAAEEEARSRMRRGLPAAEKPASLADVAREWLEVQYGVKETTLEDYRRSVKRIASAIGHIKAGAVDEVHVARLVEELRRQDLAPHTVRKTLQVLKRVLEYAHERGYRLARPPKIKLPRGVVRRQDVPLEPEQFLAVVEAADDYWRPFFLVLGLFGLRLGEAAALTTGDVDLAARRLSVRRTLTKAEGSPSRRRGMRSGRSR